MKKNSIRGPLSYAFAGLLSDKNGLYTYEDNTMNGNNNPFRGKQKKPNYSCITGGGTRNYIPYSDKALKYFEETNNDTEFTSESIGNFDYMSYLLGDEMDVSGSFESDMMENEESDDEWYID